MYVAKCKQGDNWNSGELIPYGNISISPASTVLNYGQGLFEGMKAYKTA
jgi:branched-chain amino acid aminotransferase